MRFLHTADWQIGMKAQGLGRAGEGVRQERLSAGERVVEAARARKVDCLLVAGDLFEDNGVDRRLIQRVGDILASAGCDVFIIPGNHDPAVPGSVWEHPVWKSKSTLHVLTEPKELAWRDVIFYPCPALEKSSSRDPTAWIRADRGERFCVGIAHGTVEGIRQDEPDYPIARDAASRSGVDYLALGHWHSSAFYRDEEGAIRLAYSGTHETTRFGERASGNVLVVDIATAGSPPAIEEIRTGGLRWEVISAKLRSGDEIGSVLRTIESLDRPASTLLTVRLEGVLPAAAREELKRIEEIVSSRFLFGRLEAQDLRPSPEDDSWLAGLPAGVIRDTADKLRRLAAAGGAGERGKIAARALLELYAIAGEVHR